MDANQFAMVSEWMVNGNIKEYIVAQSEANRFELVWFSVPPPPSLVTDNRPTRQLQGVARGLIYMHGHPMSMIHGDLKGVRVLIRTIEYPFCSRN